MKKSNSFVFVLVLILSFHMSTYATAAESYEVCEQSYSQWEDVPIGEGDRSRCNYIAYDDTRTKIKLSDGAVILINDDGVTVYVPNESVTIYERSESVWLQGFLNVLNNYSRNWRFTGCQKYGAVLHKTFCHIPIYGTVTLRAENQKTVLPYIKISGNKQLGIEEKFYYISKAKSIDVADDFWLIDWPDDLTVNDLRNKELERAKG